MLKRTLFMVIACFYASWALAAQPMDPRPPAAAQAAKEILSLCQTWDDAENEKNAATLRGILDDRFVATFGAGKTVDKQGYIKAAIGDGVVDATASQALADVRVVVDGDTAVILGVNTGRGTKKGSVYSSAARFTVTWVWRHGHWRALAEHIVPMTLSAR